MKLGEVLLHALKDHGAREVFGIPGDFALPFFKVLEESGILPFYTLSHEPAIGFAADAAARMNCRLGVAAVTYGAGALNMVNPVASAYAEKSPLVVISGGPGKGEAKTGLLLHHQAKTLDSQMAIFEEITCAQTRLDDADRAPAEIGRVLAAARSNSQPVYIELPRDMVEVPCGAATSLPRVAPEPEALAACAEELLERIRTARAPIMMIGVEVRRFGLEDRVAELARRLEVPVVTSLLGRGMLVEAKADLLGTYLGVAGDQEIAQQVEHSDGLLLLGVILSDTNFGVSETKIDLRRSIIALDQRVSMGYHVYAPIPLEALVDALLARLPERPDAPAHRHAEPPYPLGLVEDEQPISPTDIATAINDLQAGHGRMPIASDVGDCLFTALDIRNTDLVAPGYYATMGFGVPAGLGLQASTRLRPLILVGDGAFQMTGWELGNCRRYGWDPIVVLFNNRSWEMLRAFQPESKFNDLGEWQFADMAAGMGGVGRRVSTRRELGNALRAAMAERGRFQLIEVMIPPGRISPSLARFVEGVQRLRPRSP
ncbi:MAG: indolepyruvate/phenylpyruvate decarboxylase [Betaproteobacteria bacterium]|nr:indolepyruvate/phenylpyruvate decarboxylase [Betaproteobacteria bacterium]